MSSGGGGESKSGLKKYVRRKMVLDLNSIPGETSSSMEENTNSNSTRQLRGPSRPQLTQPPPPVQPAPPAPAVVTIDVEEIEDEVVICSPRRFAEAKNKSRRSANNSPAQRGNSEEEITRLSLSYNMGKRARANLTIIDCDQYVNLDDCNSQKNECAKKPSKPVENLPPPRPEPPTFSCPVCMGPLVEEMSTKCGHIFCKGCIRASIKAQGKCPTCRRKIGVKDTIRVYLPTTN